MRDAQGNLLDTVKLTITVTARTVTVHNDALTAIADETTDLDVVANDTGAVASDYIQVGAASGDAEVFEQDNHVASFWADSPGTYTFSYQLFDQNDTLLGSATATVTVTPPPPVRARNDFVDVEVHTPTPVDVLGNDIYPGAGSPVLTVTAAPGHGTATVVAGATPTITYTPAAGFVGTDTFTYRLTVGTDTDTATVTVDVARLPVQDLQADPRASGAFVHWTNPTSPDLTSIVVRYAARLTSPPATPTSGTGVTLGGLRWRAAPRSRASPTARRTRSPCSPTTAAPRWDPRPRQRDARRAAGGRSGGRGTRPVDQAGLAGPAGGHQPAPSATRPGTTPRAGPARPSPFPPVRAA